MNILPTKRPIIIVGAVTTTTATIFIADPEKVPVVSTSYYSHTVKKIKRKNCDIKFCVYEFSGLVENKTHRIPFYTSHGTLYAEFTTDSSKNKLKFLLGSCNLHSLGIINDPQGVYTTLGEINKREKLDFMMHTGDQIYADIPNPKFDSAFRHYSDCYFDAWSDCESANKLLRSVSNYMILDDHEIINNYANRDDKDKYSHGKDAYEIFQHSHNPNSYPGKYYYNFSRGGYDFFVMDCRLDRDTADGLMVSREQEDHLYQWLRATKSKFKFIVSSIPMLADVKQSEHDKWCSSKFVTQRNRILRFIVDKKIQNVVILSGDVHCSLVSKAEYYNPHNTSIPAGYIHEIVSSPMNQVEKGRKDQFNTFHTISYANSLISVDTHSFYCDHSNVCLLSVSDNELTYKYYRTKDDTKKIQLEGTIHAIK